MKAVFFKKPLEFSLEIIGEKWHQGDLIKGSLVVKNHGSEEVSPSAIGVYLAYGNSKKVKNKDPKAFSVSLKNCFDEKVSIGKGQEKGLDFEFQFAEDCAISETAASSYLICGSENDLHEVGHLRLEIEPALALSNYLEVLVDGFRFKVKSCKNKKGIIEATLVVPDLKEYSAITQYKIQMKMDGDKINLTHLFNLKKLVYEDSVQQVKDETLKILQILTPEDYLIYGKAIHRVGISKRFEEVLGKVKLKPLI